MVARRKGASQTGSSEPARGDSDGHQVALEFLKQLITLSSGVLALSATFIGQFKTTSLPLLCLLVLSWLLLASAVFLGLQAISTIVKSRVQGDTEWFYGTGQRYQAWSKALFVLGLLTFAVFALVNLLASAK